MDGKAVHWQPAERPATTPRDGEFVLDLGKLCGGANVSAYAVAVVRADRERDTVLARGSDDGVVAWWNGERLISRLVDRGYAPMQARVPVHLRVGDNRLLVKVAQGGGGWPLAAHLIDEVGVDLIDVDRVDPP